MGASWGSLWRLLGGLEMAWTSIRRGRAWSVSHLVGDVFLLLFANAEVRLSIMSGVPLLVLI